MYRKKFQVPLNRNGHIVAIIVNHAKIRTIIRLFLNEIKILVYDAGAINLREYADTRDIAVGFAAWLTVRDAPRKTTETPRAPLRSRLLSICTEN